VLVMNMNEPPALLRNGYEGPNRWLAVRLEGRASNRSAIGATVRVTVAGRTQAQAVLSQSSYYSHDDLRLHFGLGAHAAVDRIEVRWPSGAVTTRDGVPGGQFLAIRE
jgi:enediyne biosynthesis protein E4